MQNQVVAHFRDGRIMKGTTSDFAPAKPTFHIVDGSTKQSSMVTLDELKAVFFVKSLEGNSEYTDSQDAEQKGMGQKIRVRFKDGEVLTGYTNGYAAAREAFFVFPADPRSNNLRAYILQEATEHVELMARTTA